MWSAVLVRPGGGPRLSHQGASPAELVELSPGEVGEEGTAPPNRGGASE